MALRGIRVLEFAGLAPSPFCAMVLSDFGATVTCIDKMRSEKNNFFSAANLNFFTRGKQYIKLDVGQDDGRKIVHKLVEKSDVLIEPFRPGKMEALNLGPETLMKLNPQLIYTRLTGFGQKARLSHKAGHDINYLAMSGVLSNLCRAGKKPHPPINLLADFAGGGLTAALGILMALFERSKSKKGQVIDCSMTSGAAYIASFLWQSRHLPIWGLSPGTGLLDGGVFYYDTYETLDGKYMAVGALEEKFFNNFMKGIGLDPDKYTQSCDLSKEVSEIFKSKTRDEWVAIYKDLDACVTPVLDQEEVLSESGNDPAMYVRDDSGAISPAPAPSLTRTPGLPSMKKARLDSYDVLYVLRDIGLSNDEIRRLCSRGITEIADLSKL